jgi:hypothetical protein
MRTVHYMVRKPNAVREALYPSELDEREDYYGVGSFFLSGNHADDLDAAYSFWAVRDGRAIETKLERRSEAVYVAAVDRIGAFGFTARKVGDTVKYGGSFGAFGDSLLIRQLAPFDHDALDRAVREFDFYFVGFTPKLDPNR